MDGLAVAKAFGLKALSLASALAKAPLSRWRARQRAMRGDDLAGGASLRHLVEVKLAELTASSRLPPTLRNAEFRAWVLSDGAVDSFVEVLVAKAGGNPAIADLACGELARLYEQRTGETSRLAFGPINLVVADLYGQLTATAAATQALQVALALRTSVQVSAIGDSTQGRAPEATLLRLRTLAGQLLSAGRKAWRTPAFLAPLTLEANEPDDQRAPRPVAKAELIEALRAGSSIVLCGDGGIGKTTFLLELAAACLDANERTPLFVDAAVWARTGGGLPDYIASTPAAQALGISALDVVSSARHGQCTLMVNGWNEIPPERKLLCLDALTQLTTTAPVLAVVLATRTAHDMASLPAAKRVVLRGLNWQGQAAVIRSALPPPVAEHLLDYLARDSRLRHAARSPLILQGLVARAKSEAVSASVSVFDLLGAAVDSFERDDRRGLLLAEQPVFGLQARYLQALAARMNTGRTTSLSREDTLSTLGRVAAQLAAEHLLGATVHPALVLDALASHHLLQVQDDLVRFAHQRFQEYFGAAYLLRETGDTGERSALLSEAVNEPAWADSLSLVAGEMRASGTARGRARLVQAAADCDLSYACDLAGLCGFSESDDAALHQRLVSDVRALWDSELSQVRDLAVACKIASGLPSFADDLWALFESEDQQTRLHSHRLNGTPVSLRQLGADASERVDKWPPERRAEFLHEVAGHPDNYDFTTNAASTEPDAKVRAAAIAALFWHYPASMAAVNAWLNAPLEVQTKHELLNYIAYELEQGFFVEQIRAKLRSIAASELPDNTRLELALKFSDDVGPSALDVVLKRLETGERREHPDALLAIAQAHAPDRLRGLAHELVAAQRGLPEWAGHRLLHEPAEQKARAFERAWEALLSGEVKHLSAEFIGPLSSAQQTRRSIDVWMRYRQSRFDACDGSHERGREVATLLAHAPGDDLLGVVMELSVGASYEDAVELVDLLLRRVSRGSGDRTQVNPWVPTPEQFKQLFERLRDKSEVGRSPQDSLFTYLACIASQVAPAQFGELLLEALRRHLDAWTAYRAAIAEWQAQPRAPRPSNPSLGNYITSALAQWGMDALPGVLRLLSHPSAMDLVPEAVGRIVALPWSTLSKDQFFRGVGTDIEAGRTRRHAGCALRQPTPEYQAATDEAARAVARLLRVELDRQLGEQARNPKWNVRQAEYRVGGLVGILANIPSPEGVDAVTQTLGSGLVDLYRFSGALRGLVRQGWHFADARVAGALESLIERASKPAWVDDSTRHALADCIQLLFLVESPAVLKLPLGHYLREWRRFAYVGEVIRRLGEMKTDGAWSALMAIGDELAGHGQLPDDYAHSLIGALSSAQFDDFTRRIADGALAKWHISAWTAERIAPQVAEVAKSESRNLALLVGACRRAASPVADALLFEVLSLAGSDDALRQELALDALDAGRASHAGTPAYQALKKMFWLHVPLGENHYEVHPKASNSLRRGLYARAKTGGTSAVASRQILASLECSRREGERPDDEPRHPDRLDSQAWTCALVSLQEAHPTTATS